MSHQCPHSPSDRVQDDREGSIVCRGCGLVLESILFTLPPPAAAAAATTSKKEEEAFQDIANVAQSFHVPDFCSKLAATFFTQHFAKRRQDRSRHLAFSLYFVLAQEDVPRTLEEVGTMFGVDTKDLWKLESQFCLDMPTMLPSQFLPRASTLSLSPSTTIQLSFQQRQRIGARADHWAELCSFAPKTLLAASIVLEGEQEREQEQDEDATASSSGGGRRLLLRDEVAVARSLGIAPSTLKRCLRRWRSSGGRPPRSTTSGHGDNEAAEETRRRGGKIVDGKMSSEMSSEKRRKRRKKAQAL